jgi:hypothetical protein
MSILRDNCLWAPINPLELNDRTIMEGDFSGFSMLQEPYKWFPTYIYECQEQYFVEICGGRTYAPPDWYSKGLGINLQKRRYIP